MGDFISYLRGYLTNVRTKIGQRNFIGQECERSIKNLYEKKIKKITGKLHPSDINDSILDRLNLKRDLIDQQPRLAKKLLYLEDSKKCKDFLVLFGIFNQNIFEEILYFEEYLLKSIVGSFNQFA